MYEYAVSMIESAMSEAESEKVVAVSRRGQATIPKVFREELGIEAPGRVKFVRTASGEVVVRPIDSATDLRGILGDATDEEGRSAVDRLRDERRRDAARGAVLRSRGGEDPDNGHDGGEQ